MTQSTKLTGKNLEIAQAIQRNITHYTKPQEQFIGDGAKKLYQHEERRAQLIRSCAAEWARLNGLDKDDDKVFWYHAIPQALFDTLNSYTPATGAIVAEAFLEKLGYEIKRPVFEKEVQS